METFHELVAEPEEGGESSTVGSVEGSDGVASSIQCDESETFCGGYDADFDTPLPTDFTCCICFLAFREPMQLPCGHQFCKICLDTCRETQVSDIEVDLIRNA